jgi:hypothetical protein
MAAAVAAGAAGAAFDAAGGGCWPVTGYNSHENKPSRCGRLAAVCDGWLSASAWPQARKIAMPIATPRKTLAPRALPPIGVRRTRSVVAVGEYGVGIY